MGTHWKVDDDALYSTDNGRILCGRHLGCSARYTGRDISGQPIHRLTDAERQMVVETEYGSWSPRCESCESGYERVWR